LFTKETNNINHANSTNTFAMRLKILFIIVVVEDGMVTIPNA
jgi:hypothetical protein